MRLRYACLLAAAAVLAQSAVLGARADDPEGRAHQITIITSPSALPVGTECRIEMNPEVNDRKEVVEITYEGKVAEAKDDGIMLTITFTRQVISKGSAVSRIPIANRLFRNVGIGRPKPGEEQKVWIAAEKIRSVKLAPNSTL